MIVIILLLLNCNTPSSQLFTKTPLRCKLGSRNTLGRKQHFNQCRGLLAIWVITQDFRWKVTWWLQFNRSSFRKILQRTAELKSFGQFSANSLWRSAILVVLQPTSRTFHKILFLGWYSSGNLRNIFGAVTFKTTFVDQLLN